MKNEKHPWMKGFTIGTLLAGIITGLLALSQLGSISSSYDPSSTGAAVLWALIAAVAMIWGSIWLLKKSEGFQKWSSLSGGQRALGVLIMFPGFYAGIAVIVMIAAIGSELSRRD